jgi:hypothetical protein
MSAKVGQIPRSTAWQKRGFVRAVIVAGALLYTVTGLLMLFASEWFYQNVGTFPPFNRHYTGDLGSFTLPIGIALLWAARNPAKHRLMVACGAFAGLIHALNHLYDDALLGALGSQTIILLVFGLLLVLAWWWSRESE